MERTECFPSFYDIISYFNHNLEWIVGLSHDPLSHWSLPVHQYISTSLYFGPSVGKSPGINIKNKPPKCHIKIHSLLSKSGITLWLPISSFYTRANWPHPPLMTIDVILLENIKQISANGSIDPHLGRTNIIMIYLLKGLWYIHTYILGVYRYSKIWFWYKMN